MQPVLLPGSVYSIGSKHYPPARAMIDAGLAVVRPGDGETGVEATFVGWHPDFGLRDIEAACRAGWAGAPLYTASAAPFFATRAGKTVGISGAICAAIRSVTGARVTVLGKPSLLALRAASRRLGVVPARMVVVGDDPTLEVAMARAGDHDQGLQQPRLLDPDLRLGLAVGPAR